MKLHISFDEGELDTLYVLVQYATSVISSERELRPAEESMRAKVVEARETFKRLKPGRSK